MKDRADADSIGIDDTCGPLRSPRANAYHPSRIQDGQGLQKTLVASLKQRSSLRSGELVGGAVPTRSFQEDQWAIVEHEEPIEESLGRPIASPRPAPKTGAAHLGSRAIETEDRAPRMLMVGGSHGSADPHPVAHHHHIAERHSGLPHPERAGVHADEHDLLSRAAEASQVELMGCLRIAKRIVNMGNGRAEIELRDSVAQRSRYLDQITLPAQQR